MVYLLNQFNCAIESWWFSTFLIFDHFSRTCFGLVKHFWMYLFPNIKPNLNPNSFPFSSKIYLEPKICFESFNHFNVFAWKENEAFRSNLNDAIYHNEFNQIVTLYGMMPYQIMQTVPNVHKFRDPNAKKAKKKRLNVPFPRCCNKITAQWGLFRVDIYLNSKLMLLFILFFLSRNSH